MPRAPHARRAAALALFLAPLPAAAQERVSVAEDPFDISSPSATPAGEVEVTLGGAFERARRGRARTSWSGEVEVEAGIAPGLELRFGQQGRHGRAAPRDAEESAPSWGGRTRLGLRWGLAEERGPWPAFGLIGEVRTAYGESRPATEFVGTAAFGRTLLEGERPVSAYLNLGWAAAVNPEPGERPGRYVLAAALGQQVTPDTALVAAYLREQGDRGEGDSNLVQAGFRHRLGEGLPVLGVALGAGMGRDSPRWQLGVALQWSFGGR